MNHSQNPIFKIVFIIIIVVGIAVMSFYIGKGLGGGGEETKIEPSKELSPLEIEEMKKRDAQRKADLKIIQQALESYYNDHGRYPYLLANSTNSLWRRNLKEELQKYISGIPVDPLNNEIYYYSFDGSLSGGQMYVLAATLENRTDPEGPAYVIYGGHP